MDSENNIKTNEETDKVLTKICTNPECHLAGIEQPLQDFHKKTEAKDGRKSQCKVCRNLKKKDYLSDPKVKLARREQGKEYRSRPEVKKKSKITRSLYYKATKTSKALYAKERSKKPEVKERRRELDRKRYATPNGRLNGSMKALVRGSLGSKKAGRHWESLVGYTIEDLISHLEQENLLLPHPETGEEMVIGKSKIDLHHIQPVSTFDYESAEDPEFKECWHYTNLQPLWFVDHKAINHFDIINLIKACKEAQEENKEEL